MFQGPQVTQRLEVSGSAQQERHPSRVHRCISHTDRRVVEQEAREWNHEKHNAVVSGGAYSRRIVINIQQLAQR